MQRLLVATTSSDKLQEIRPILRNVPVRIVTLVDYPCVAAPEETGRTFAENARAKANYYAQATGALTMAEDSGLEIDALHGAPGVESARYGGVDASYPEKFARIYDALRRRNVEGDVARLVCAIAVAREGRVLFEAAGVIEGRIASKPKGDSGFGYDPIFHYPPFNGTLAEAGDRK